MEFVGAGTAQALLPLINEDKLVEQLESFDNVFSEQYFSIMNGKFGLLGGFEAHQSFINDSLIMLERCKLDFSIFFRKLSEIHEPHVFKTLRNHTYSKPSETCALTSRHLIAGMDNTNRP